MLLIDNNLQIHTNFICIAITPLPINSMELACLWRRDRQPFVNLICAEIGTVPGRKHRGTRLGPYGPKNRLINGLRYFHRISIVTKTTYFLLQNSACCTTYRRRNICQKYVCVFQAIPRIFNRNWRGSSQGAVNSVPDKRKHAIKLVCRQSLHRRFLLLGVQVRVNVCRHAAPFRELV